jgi:hypothetical protein
MSDSILYFVRGRGRGHALAAIAIADCLAKLRPAVKVRFVSYGTGAETLRERGRPVLDLDLPDRPGLFAIERKLPTAFKRAPRPSLVLAHEEFDVPIAARVHGLPCVVLTDWFLNDPDDWRMESLKDARDVLFLDERSGIFVPPEYAKRKVRYVGPVLRPSRYRRSDRLRARQEAGFDPEALVVSVFIHPGRRSESIAPLSVMLRAAFDSLEHRGPKLLVCNRDSDSEFDRTMAASDLAITKGNRNVVLELAAMGVPAVSMSHGLNVIDDLRTAALPNNRTVSYEDMDPPKLARLMTERIAARTEPLPLQDGALGAARRLVRLMGRAVSARNRTRVPHEKTSRTA